MLKPKSKTLKEKILSVVDDFTIYNFYIPDLAIGCAMRSPLRNERRPSFVVRYGTNDNLYHKDYGNDDYYGNCFSFVMQKFGLSFDEALLKIDCDMELGITAGTPKERFELSSIIPVIKEHHLKKIEAETRPFTTKDLKWWLQYGITEQDLIREHIYSIETYRMENDKREMREMYKAKNELCFGYKFFDDDGKFIGWKIYFPRRDNFKWFSSVPNTTIEGLSNIQDFRRLIITKSRKDRIVLSKILPNVINSQNESRSFLTDEYKELFSNFREVYVWFDSDEPGMKACKKICKEMEWKFIHTPFELLEEGIKDPAEWRKVYRSDKPIISFLKSKNML